jgi:adenine-specific DNA methylase
MTTRKPLFIEKIMPVKLLNEQVYHEHGGNPFKGLHRWYSRKPLSFSRASVLGSLLPDGVSIEEFEYLLGLEWRKYKDLDEQIRTFCPTWKDMFNPRQLLTLVTYVEILNDAKAKLQIEYEPEKVEAIATYLALVLDRCAV